MSKLFSAIISNNMVHFNFYNDRHNERSMYTFIDLLIFQEKMKAKVGFFLMLKAEDMQDI